MQPRQIVRATSFGPDALSAIFRAFDEAWSEIAPKIDAATAESARTSLARIVLALAAADTIAAGGLRAMAVAVFCAKHRIDVDGAG